MVEKKKTAVSNSVGKHIT